MVAVGLSQTQGITSTARGHLDRWIDRVLQANGAFGVAGSTASADRSSIDANGHYAREDIFVREVHAIPSRFVLLDVANSLAGGFVQRDRSDVALKESIKSWLCFEANF